MDMFLRGSEVLAAEETLRLCQISAYPHLKKATRAKFYTDIKRLVRIDNPEEQKPVSLEEFAKRLGTMIHG